ncbi:riboflavin biosynthesis protein RibF [Guggenheimella bovis]
MIVHTPNELQKGAYAITIGTFDGVHLGHQKVLSTLIEEAKARGLRALVVTFTNNPKSFIKHEPENDVISVEDKLRLIDEMGVDVLALPFNDFIRNMSEKEFLDYLSISIELIIVGYDFRFGNEHSEHIQTIERKLVEPVYYLDEVISSTRIRRLLSNGDLKTANHLLGRPLSYEGEVEHGRKRGKNVLGFPTMNVRVSNSFHTIRRGVYVTRTIVEGKSYPSVTNIGFNPSFSDKPFTLETHLLDFDSDMYGNVIRVEFLEFLRDEMRFEDLSDLSKQIQSDVTQVKKYFNIKG